MVCVGLWAEAHAERRAAADGGPGGLMSLFLLAHRPCTDLSSDFKALFCLELVCPVL